MVSRLHLLGKLCSGSTCSKLYKPQLEQLRILCTEFPALQHIHVALPYAKLLKARQASVRSRTPAVSANDDDRINCPLQSLCTHALPSVDASTWMKRAADLCIPHAHALQCSPAGRCGSLGDPAGALEPALLQSAGRLRAGRALLPCSAHKPGVQDCDSAFTGALPPAIDPTALASVKKATQAVQRICTLRGSALAFGLAQQDHFTEVNKPVIKTVHACVAGARCSGGAAAGGRLAVGGSDAQQRGAQAVQAAPPAPLQALRLLSAAALHTRRRPGMRSPSSVPVHAQGKCNACLVLLQLQGHRLLLLLQWDIRSMHVTSHGMHEAFHP